MAYLLIAGLLIAVAVLLARARYYSRPQVLRRSRQADEARRAKRTRLRDEGAIEE